MQGESVLHLSESHYHGVRRVVSALMTGEESEKLIFEPLILAFAGNDRVLSYLGQHAADERRHAEVLKNYLWSAFGFRKTKRTLTDRLIYDGLLPLVKKWLRSEPKMGIVLLFAYEVYTSKLYGLLQQRFRHLKLPVLQKITGQIIADEKKHLAGLRWLEGYTKGSLSLQGRMKLRFLLKVFRWDVSINQSSLHNRGLRHAFLSIGIDPTEFELIVNESIENARSLISLAPANRGNPRGTGRLSHV